MCRQNRDRTGGGKRPEPPPCSGRGGCRARHGGEKAATHRGSRRSARGRHPHHRGVRDSRGRITSGPAPRAAPLAAAAAAVAPGTAATRPRHKRPRWPQRRLGAVPISSRLPRYPHHRSIRITGEIAIAYAQHLRIYRSIREPQGWWLRGAVVSLGGQIWAA